MRRMSVNSNCQIYLSVTIVVDVLIDVDTIDRSVEILLEPYFLRALGYIMGIAEGYWIY